MSEETEEKPSGTLSGMSAGKISETASHGPGADEQGALDELFEKVQAYRTTEMFGELLRFIRRFPGIAPYNAFLLHMQRPGTRYVETVRNWKMRFGRTVRPGARPLILLHPFGPVRFVFELSDTEGADFPEELLHPFRTEGRIAAAAYERLLGNLRSYGIEYRSVEYGTTLAGSIQQTAPVRRTYGGRTYVMHFTILLNAAHSREEQFATVTHELGHLFCGHLGTYNPHLWKDRSGLSLNSREFEAESVSWLVCERQSVHNPSDKYLHGYLERENVIPDISLETVFRAVSRIEHMITSTSIRIPKEVCPSGS